MVVENYSNSVGETLLVAVGICSSKVVVENALEEEETCSSMVVVVVT